MNNSMFFQSTSACDYIFIYKPLGYRSDYGYLQGEDIDDDEPGWILDGTDQSNFILELIYD